MAAVAKRRERHEWRELGKQKEECGMQYRSEAVKWWMLRDADETATVAVISLVTLPYAGSARVPECKADTSAGCRLQRSRRDSVML